MSEALDGRDGVSHDIAALAELEQRIGSALGARRGQYRPNPYEVRRTSDDARSLLAETWDERRTRGSHKQQWDADSRTLGDPVPAMMALSHRAGWGVRPTRRCTGCQLVRPWFDFPTDSGYRGPSWALGSPDFPVCYPCRLTGATELTRACWRCGEAFLIPHGGSERRWCSLGCQSAGQRAAARGVVIPKWEERYAGRGRGMLTVQPECATRFASELNAERTVGKNGKSYPARRATGERDGRIRTLRASGLSLREIASEVGCSVGTVHRIVRST